MDQSLIKRTLSSTVVVVLDNEQQPYNTPYLQETPPLRRIYSASTGEAAGRGADAPGPPRAASAAVATAPHVGADGR